MFRDDLESLQTQPSIHRNNQKASTQQKLFTSPNNQIQKQWLAIYKANKNLPQRNPDLALIRHILKNPPNNGKPNHSWTNIPTGNTWHYPPAYQGRFSNLWDSEPLVKRPMQCLFQDCIGRLFLVQAIRKIQKPLLKLGDGYLPFTNKHPHP